jgi:hypothetical protein
MLDRQRELREALSREEDKARADFHAALKEAEARLLAQVGGCVWVGVGGWVSLAALP